MICSSIACPTTVEVTLFVADRSSNGVSALAPCQ
jgi:hypothetical protein